MRKLVILVLLLIASYGLSAQKTLVLEKIGTRTRFGYHLGDDLKIKVKDYKQNLHNYIWNLTDTSLTIGSKTTVQLSDISSVYRHYYFPKLMTRILLYAGAGYLVLDSFNNLINKERVFNPQTLIISGSLICVGFAIMPVIQRKCNIGIKWKLKVMDINLD
jgi:hypothetical protein